MARIWRKGQKNTVKIYRFLSSGTIDERIYHRQLSKLEMKSSIFDEMAAESRISAEDLRDIFSLDETSDCLTHSLSHCPCLSENICTDWMHLPLNKSMDSYERWNSIDDSLDISFFECISSMASFAYVRSD